MEDKKLLSLYIHIPFCERKCSYCAFLSFVCKEEYVIKKYFEILLKEIEIYSTILRELDEEYEIDTIYIGGGTPSVIDSKYIEMILCDIKNQFDLKEDIEITIEVNPNSATEEKLMIYKASGVNRLSIGAQSFDDEELSVLGRIHTKNDIIKTFNNARKLGYNNISIDLIFDIPNQKEDIWKSSLEQVINLKPEHISLYSLEIEDNTEFYKRYKNGEFSLKDKNTLDEYYKNSIKHLSEENYVNYEISNFAKNNRESRHNQRYWKYKEYIGMGMGASSFFKNRRWKNQETIKEYEKEIDKLSKYGMDILENLQENSQKEEMGIYVFTSLRRRQGLSFSEFYKTFNQDFKEVFKKEFNNILKEYEEYIVITEENLFLNDDGILRSNEIMCEFI